MIEVKLIYKQENFLNDVQDIPRAFSPYLVINDDSEHFIKWDYSYINNIFNLKILSDIFPNKEIEEMLYCEDNYDFKKKIKHKIKVELYKYLSAELQIILPYGSLTGVRPTKLYYELSKKTEDVKKILVENYYVSEEKANLISQCVENQKKYINRENNNVSLFLNIPFCPSRCKYCSFISTEVFRVRKELPFYVECAKKEIRNAFEICEKKGYSVRSVYVGGGTPTSIGSGFLNDLLLPFKNLGVEFTVEAGRPDAIDEIIIDVLKNNNVTRVSVNPQTFSDETLSLIGRRHTVDDFLFGYELMKKAGFSINTDLIAGLPGETVDIFRNSVNSCIALSPDNITIHSLSLKRGSDFINSGMVKKEYGSVKEMIDFGHKSLFSAGYVPYYMYRQKNMADNLENTGYSIPGKQCIYNIDMMEEVSTIIGAGAGAMTKLVIDDKIERFSSPKGFREYCERIDSTVNSKNAFFSI